MSPLDDVLLADLPAWFSISVNVAMYLTLGLAHYGLWRQRRTRTR